MPVPPLPRLSIYLELSGGGVTPIASWELPSDGAVDVTPGQPGTDDALAWMHAWSAQEGAAPPAMPSPIAFEFGADNVAATTTTRYLPAGYQSGTANPDPMSFRMPVAGSLSALRVRHNRVAGNGEQIVYTLRVNGVPTSLTASLASTDTDGSDLVNSVAVAIGDLVDIEVTKALGIGTSPTEITASMRLDV